MENFLFKEETYQIIGICMEVQKTLGYGFSEAVYKDAMELEFIDTPLRYLRERELAVAYKGRILRHRFITDFLCCEKIIVEVKSSNAGIIEDHIAQTLNYLRVSDNTISLIINFGKRRLEYKRLIL
jgi:GxxExxY protein